MKLPPLHQQTDGKHTDKLPLGDLIFDLDFTQLASLEVYLFY